VPVAIVAYTYGWFLAFGALLAFFVVWAIAAFSVLRRGDLGVLAKIVWIVLMLVFPLVGLLVYYLWQAGNPDRTR
jgi:hypothetical protein